MEDRIYFMTNDKLQELLNLILFTDEITLETDNAHVAICEYYNEVEKELEKLRKDRDDLKREYDDMIASN